MHHSIDHRERTRDWLALGLLVLLATVIVAMVMGVEPAKEAAPVLLPLVATAIGFYFGGRPNQQRGDQTRGGKNAGDGQRSTSTAAPRRRH